ncbi:unnamed protein product [Clavelina lepadiformis]|uniref:Flavin-containing monooxygenase n=1 Tax=Clavelina lepadiformis TaxID=159417 RepID=A0ABP0GAP8_CLALP
MNKSVCIVGAGTSGLACIKACLDEGIKPVCFETTADLGGLWNNVARAKHDVCVKLYPSLVTNVSKVNSSFSDFPAPKDWPPYLDQNLTLDYLRMYAEKFGLTEHIQFDTEVVKVFPSNSYEVTGTWIVKTKNLITNDVNEKEYDAVIVATGKFAKQVKADVPGLHDVFKGTVIHSGDYTDQEIFRDKSVLVIGCSASGCDLACDAAVTAKNVFLCARSGTWLAPRIHTNGLPLDLSAANRFTRALLAWIPAWLANSMFKNVLEARMNHEACGILSQYPPTNKLATITITDELPIKIYSGRVKTRPGIERVTDNHVIFENSAKEKIDMVVMATGYKAHFPFLSEDVFPDDIENARLYKWIFPMELKHPSTLTFVCLFPPGSGSAMTSAELQARFVGQVLSGKTKLPSKKSMRNKWRESRDLLLQNTRGRFVFKEGLFEYQEDLAQELRLIPPFFKLLFTDPRLAFKLYFGPVVPYHYRLCGNHSWEQARDRSLNITDEIMSGMKK